MAEVRQSNSDTGCMSGNMYATAHTYRWLYKTDFRKRRLTNILYH